MKRLKSHGRYMLTVGDEPLEGGCAERKQATHGACGLSSATELR